MDEVFAVDVLYPWYELVSQKEDCFEAESSGAEVKEVFQGGAKELHHHHVEVPLRPTPFDGGDPNPTLQQQKPTLGMFQ